MEQYESKGVYRIPTPTPFPVGAANLFLHKGECVTLFDTGTKSEAAWGVLTCRLRDMGVELRDIDQIILTHHHLDHIGLSCRLKEASGATIYAHPAVPEQIPYMFDEAETRVHLEAVLTELGVPANITDTVISLRHGFRELLDAFTIDETVSENVPIGPFTAHFRPGHSATDTVYVHNEAGWAFTGDHLISNVTPNPILRRPSANGVREQSLVQYCEALRRTRELDISVCFPGHGAAFQDHRAVVDATFRHIERRGEKVLRTIPAEGATPHEITCILFPHLAEPQLYYCLSAAAGHLELLESQGQLQSTRRNGVLRYTLPNSAHLKKKETVVLSDTPP